MPPCGSRSSGNATASRRSDVGPIKAMPNAINRFGPPVIGARQRRRRAPAFDIRAASGKGTPCRKHPASPIPSPPSLQLVICWLSSVQPGGTGQAGTSGIGLMVTRSLVVMGDAQLTTTPEHPRGAMLRGYDKTTGKEVGAIFMAAPQSGSPMTYLADGQQYIVCAGY